MTTNYIQIQNQKTGDWLLINPSKNMVIEKSFAPFKDVPKGSSHQKHIELLEIYFDVCYDMYNKRKINNG